ncbi:sterile alpha motif domain-containing protein 3-like isoform X1 [Triplophysa dalaica]|uniref:sterile alpha motif domain-containing protein 3-like isoform X1 n=1 Tax=Triplophysa dalaica TaxID=1582913 RepID=UPI0024DFB1FA|nr:sterile alpha motif domain-containing protein 3-like isoform X1 [Triplophysa dalaica]
MCFLENDIDGETVDCGLTEAMVGYLFDGSFKKQIKFQQFVRQYKEAETIVILEPVPVGVANSTAELQPTPSNDSSGEPAHKRLPVVIVIPTFPKDVQTRLDAKESCQKVPKIRHKIIRVLYEIMAEYTMYPTNAEYIQVAKALIVKYPFLRDKEGNGYHTWHMSLKRKYKAERAPLVSDSEVRKLKEKFGHKNQSKATSASSRLCRKPASVASDICVGEDLMSVEAHVKVLQSECSKTHPDVSSVKDLMARTFSWRRREVTEGMPVDDVLKKYPYLRMPSGLFNEVDQIHPSTSSFCARFRDCFTAVLPNVLKLAKGQSHLTKHYTDARQDALAEDLPGIDLRAGLIFLPSIFREKIEHLITVGEGDPATPYPTIQLMDNDWIMAISGRGFSVVKVDGIAVCQCTSIDEAFITAFSMYFAFNIAYPVHLKNTLTFLQRCIVSIVEEGEKPLPVTLLRKINLLY